MSSEACILHTTCDAIMRNSLQTDVFRTDGRATAARARATKLPKLHDRLKEGPEPAVTGGMSVCAASEKGLLLGALQSRTPYLRTPCHNQEPLSFYHFCSRAVGRAQWRQSPP